LLLVKEFNQEFGIRTRTAAARNLARHRNGGGYDAGGGGGGGNEHSLSKQSLGNGRGGDAIVREWVEISPAAAVNPSAFLPAIYSSRESAQVGPAANLVALPTRRNAATKAADRNADGVLGESVESMPRSPSRRRRRPSAAAPPAADASALAAPRKDALPSPLRPALAPRAASSREVWDVVVATAEELSASGLRAALHVRGLSSATQGLSGPARHFQLRARLLAALCQDADDADDWNATLVAPTERTTLRASVRPIGKPALKAVPAVPAVPAFQARGPAGEGARRLLAFAQCPTAALAGPRGQAPKCNDINDGDHEIGERTGHERVDDDARCKAQDDRTPNLHDISDFFHKKRLTSLMPLTHP
jgi:hypothetical protein